MTVVIVNILSKNNFNTFTTDETFEGQRFAILMMSRIFFLKAKNGHLSSQETGKKQM